MTFEKLLASFSVFLIAMMIPSSVFSQSSFWRQTTGPGAGMNWKISSDPNGNIYATSADSGFYRSSDRGDHWTSINGGLPEPHPAAFIAASPFGPLFGGGYFPDLFRSSDRGTNWSNAGLGKNQVLSMLFSSDSEILAGCSFYDDSFERNGRIFRSIDSGRTWQLLVERFLYAPVSSLAGDLKGTTIAGTWRGIYRSTDHGTSWQDIGVAPNVWALSYDSAKGIMAGSWHGVFRSTDDGANWAQVGLPDTFVTDMVVTPLGHIFASTEIGGVFRSTDQGQDWVAINSGLTDSSIFSLTISSDGFLYAGTASGYVFRSSESIVSVQQSRLYPISFSLGQNYPNPFNPSTSIPFSIPTRAHVRLLIFNLLGQLVQTITDEQKQPGTYVVTWDVSHTPSGVYFYRMTAGDFVQTNRAILVK